MTSVYGRRISPSRDRARDSLEAARIERVWWFSNAVPVRVEVPSLLVASRVDVIGTKAREVAVDKPVFGHEPGGQMLIRPNELPVVILV